MGSMLILLLAIFLLAMIVLWCVKCCQNGKCHTRVSQVKRKVFWNFFLRYTLQSFLKISIAALFAVSMINFTESSASSSINATINIIMVVLIAFLPLFYAILLNRNRNELEKEDMK